MVIPQEGQGDQHVTLWSCGVCTLGSLTGQPCLRLDPAPAPGPTLSQKPFLALELCVDILAYGTGPNARAWLELGL